MAEPTWDLQVRRTKARRRVVHGRKKPWPFQRNWFRSRVFRVWSLWLLFLWQRPFFVSLGNFYAWRLFQAARFARAALEDVPPASFVDTPIGTRATPSVGHRLGILRLPLRYVAHMITIFVVCGLMFCGDSASLRGGGAFDMLQQPPSRVTLGGGGDSVHWKPSIGQMGTEHVLTMPEVRNPQFAAEPAFVEFHQVAEGETLGTIAAQYHVDAASLFWANGLDHDGILAVDQVLRIPRIAGIPHVIRSGETLASIAADFQVTDESIILFKANGIRDGQLLPVGQEIFIYGGTHPNADQVLTRYGGGAAIENLVPVFAGVVQSDSTNLRSGPGPVYPRVLYLDAGQRLRLIARHGGWVKGTTGDDVSGWVRSDLLGLSDTRLAALVETSDFPAPPPRWMWPASGAITSPFGWRSQPFRSFHDGVDIANAAGTRIRAARQGTVIEAGWCRGFGYCVKIDHGDGVLSIYGHLLKQPSVRVGDSVDIGSPIGLMGSSFDRSGGGYSTGVHLHFTIKINGSAVNPLRFLP